MRCPFLRDEQVRSCQAAPFRKSLARALATAELERCSSAAHASCPMAPAGEASDAAPRCPALAETLVQFCALTPLPTYVPWSASPELRCGHGGHRYCELFLEASQGRPTPGAERPCDARVHVVEGVPMPGWLLYAGNHLWLDPGDDGVCHLGVDAFVSQLTGPIERLAFLSLKGSVRPSVVLTAGGVDLTLAFPLPLLLVAANTRLRFRLDRLSSDPYGLGWLFEARFCDGQRRAVPDTTGLLREGARAREWMAQEVSRASALLQARPAQPHLAADGGRFANGVLRQLEREEALRLLAALFR